MEIVCKTCGHEGVPGHFNAGSTESELLVWAISFALALMVHWTFALGAAAYTGWRLANRYRGCAACKAPGVRPGSHGHG